MLSVPPNRLPPSFSIFGVSLWVPYTFKVTFLHYFGEKVLQGQSEEDHLKGVFLLEPLQNEVSSGQTNSLLASSDHLLLM